MAQRILIVDDEELNRKLFSTILQERDYEVSMAVNGEEALAMIENNTFSLILLDIFLPKMTGLEVLKTCRGKGLLTTGAKVYALTGAMMSEIDEAGFDGVIMKPIRVMEFLKIVEQALQ